VKYESTADLSFLGESAKCTHFFCLADSFKGNESFCVLSFCTQCFSIDLVLYIKGLHVAFILNLTEYLPFFQRGLTKSESDTSRKDHEKGKSVEYLKLDDLTGTMTFVNANEFYRKCRPKHAWSLTIHKCQGSEFDTVVYGISGNYVSYTLSLLEINL
jgi:hypothetical protein